MVIVYNFIWTIGEIIYVYQTVCNVCSLSAGKWQSCYQNSSLLTSKPGILVLALWFFSGRWPSPSLMIDSESQEGKEKDALRGREL